MDPVRAIADAVLYEGYLLWPYRRTALKNQRRWTFGGVYPPAHSARHPDDAWRMRTECLLEADGAPRVDVRVRFLHVVARQLFAGGRPVDELVVDGERHVTWDEAVEREVLLQGPGCVPISIDAGRVEEPLGDGSMVHSWEALRRTFCSTHTVLRTRTGAFVSQTDPPERLRAAANACRNEGTWPVLVDGDRTVLSSPIILEDHPRVAPESPGDLFDGGEIDQLLVLNILSLTDEEKAEMRATDPRAREILERTEALTEDELMRLHGTIRELGMTR